MVKFRRRGQKIVYLRHLGLKFGGGGSLIVKILKVWIFKVSSISCYVGDFGRQKLREWRYRREDVDCCMLRVRTDVSGWVRRGGGGMIFAIAYEF